MKEIIKMGLIKSTKNTHVFGADKDKNITSLYVKRSAFKTSEPPKSITVTIETAEQADEDRDLEI